MNIEESASNYVPTEETTENIEQENKGINEVKEDKGNWLINMLKSETGEGTIQSYNNHPLNIKSNNYVSQIIRGMTGMLGSLNFAILDIILGGLGFAKETKENDVSYTIEDDIINKKNSQDGPTIVNGQHV